MPARRAPTASLASQKKKKTGTATLEELERIQVDGRAKHIKARNTTKKYGEYVAAGKRWLAGYFPDSAPPKTTTEEEGEEAMDVDAPETDTNVTTDGETPTEADDPYQDPEFKKAFSDVPNKHSDKALALYISFKCFHEDLKEGTGQMIKAAFKYLWENSKGSKYRGRWHLNPDTKEWEGNPVYSAEVEDTMTAIKHKSGAEGGDRTHSIAMSKEHMEKIFAWSEKVCPKEMLRTPAKTMQEQGFRVKHLLFRAFASTAWTIWSRNFELVKIKMKQLHLNLEDETAFGAEYHSLQLLDRKGWQGKVHRTRREPTLQSNTFKIYKQNDLPSCDAFHWLKVWIEYLEKEVYKRPLGPEDYVFPGMGANDVVQPGEMISADTVQKYINEFTHGADIRVAVGSFSTHCFRRGGAQYRFMFAPVGKRWTLKKVRFWGGWAEGEHRDTLIKYLLDELYTYEENFSDALCPVQKEADISFLGEHKSIAPITNETFHLMHGQLSADVKGIQTSVVFLKDSMTQVTSCLWNMAAGGQTNGIPFPLIQPPMHLPNHAPEAYYSRHQTPRMVTAHPTHPLNLPLPPPNWQPPPQNCMTFGQPGAAGSPPNYSQTFSQPGAAPLTSSTSTVSAAMKFKKPKEMPTHPNIIPDLPIKLPDGTRSLKKDSWRIIVDHWTKGDKERGLNEPLKDWPQKYLQGPNRPLFAVKHHQRAMIATEFINRYKANDEDFLKAYPVAVEGHSKLFSAIEAARRERGEIIARPRIKS